MIPVGYEQNMEHICSRDVRENPKPQQGNVFSRPYHFMEGKKIMDALKGRYQDPCIILKALQELEDMCKSAVRLHNAVCEPGLFLEVVHLIATSEDKEIVYHCYRVMHTALKIRPDLLCELGCLDSLIESVLKLAEPFEPYYVFGMFEMSYASFLYGSDVAVPLDKGNGLSLVKTAVQWLARLQETGFESRDPTRRPFDGAVAIYNFLQLAAKISRIVVDVIEEDMEGKTPKGTVISCIFQSRKAHEVELTAALNLLLVLSTSKVFLDALEARSDVCNAENVLEILVYPNYAIQALALRFIEAVSRHIGCCYVLFGSDPTEENELIHCIQKCLKSGDPDVSASAYEVVNALTVIGPLLAKAHKLQDDK